MKKKRLMPMCLCLVLALGLAACDDLEDLLPSSGDDETSEVSPTEPGDTGDDTEPTDPEGPSESVPTYSIEIVYPVGDISLEIGDSETIAVSLVTTVDNTDSRVAGTASNVTLYSSDPSIVSTSGLTITALDVGETVITATWTEHGVTSSGLNVKVTAPVYTPTVEYSIAITSPSSGISVLTNTSIPIGVSLITTVDGTPTSEEGSAETVKLNISPETSSVTVDGLTIIGTVAETVTISATWIAQEITSEPITITFVEPSAEPVITYGVTITNPTSETVLNVGDSLTIAATLYTCSDEAVSASETATADNVTVSLDTSSTGSVDISGLTITGKTAGEVTLTVTWGEYATASVTFKVESVVTYGVAITSPSEGSEVEVGSTLTFTVDLITYTDGIETSRDTSVSSGVTLTQSSNDGGEVDINGLTITGKTAGEVTITATDTHGNIDSVTIKVIEAQVFESYTITIQLKTSDGNAFPAPTGTYSIFINSEYDMTSGGEDESYWESWGTHLMTYDSNTDTYSYTYNSLPSSTNETHTANFYASTSTSENDINWDNQLGYYMISVTQDSVGTLSSGVQEITTSFTSWDDIFNPPASDVTFIYTITFAYEGTTLDAAGTGVYLYASGDFNGTWNEGTGSGGWYDWGNPVQLVDIGNGSYTLTLDFVPENNRSFEIVIWDSTNHEYNDMWNYVLAEYTITGNDTTATGTITKSITLEAKAASIDEILNPSFTVTIAIKDSGNSSSTQFYIEGDGIGWSLVAMEKASGNNSYDQYYTYNQAKTSNIKFWIGQSGATYEGGGVGNSSVTFSYNANDYYGWVSYSEWGFDISKMSGDAWKAANSLTIILTFPFSSYDSTSAADNYLVTNVSFVLA